MNNTLLEFHYTEYTEPNNPINVYIPANMITLVQPHGERTELRLLNGQLFVVDESLDVVNQMLQKAFENNKTISADDIKDKQKNDNNSNSTVTPTINSRNTYEIAQIMNSYRATMNDLEESELDSLEKMHTSDEIKVLYAQMIRLQCTMRFGQVMTTEDFLEDVTEGYLIDDDGSGQYLDWNGNDKGFAPCDAKSIKETLTTKEYPFVCWCNR